MDGGCGALAKNGCIRECPPVDVLKWNMLKINNAITGTAVESLEDLEFQL